MKMILSTLLTVGLLLPPSARAAEPAAPATHTVKRGNLQRTVQWDGVFESARMTPIKLSPKAWNDLTVVDAVAHGTRVKKGDVLVRLETEKLDEQLAELERERAPAKLSLEIAEAELKNLEETTPLKLAAAARSQRIATEDYDYFVQSNREQKTKLSQFNLRSSEERLASTQEELKQLEKMYRADDLTEETEEIIIKRQRFAVESAAFYLENSRRSAERELTIGLAREHETLSAKKRDEDLALALANETLPRALVKKQQDVAKMRRDQEKAARRLEDLKQDRELLNVRAPGNGIVYYGACDLGRWTTGPVVGKRLVPAGKLAANEVFMTIVDPGELQLKAIVQESDLAKVKPGHHAEINPTLALDVTLAGQLKELNLVPLPTGGYEATLSVQLVPDLTLLPGMTAKIRFDSAPRKDLVLAPKTAIFTEGDQKVVYLEAKGGTAKRVVQTGDSDERMIEIKSGLKEGDVIRLIKPD